MPNRTDELIAYLSARVGGETPGDTIVRLSRLLQAVVVEDGSPADVWDWRSWLEDLGDRLNAANDPS